MFGVLQALFATNLYPLIYSYLLGLINGFVDCLLRLGGGGDGPRINYQ